MFKRVTSAVLVAASLFSVAAPTIAAEEYDSIEANDSLYQEVAEESANDVPVLIEDEAPALPEAEVLEELAETPDDPLEDPPVDEYDADADEEEFDTAAAEEPETDTEADEETVYADWTQELTASYDRYDSDFSALTDAVFEMYGDEYSIRESAESKLYLSGWMPVGTVAFAKTAIFESESTSGESPVMVIKLALTDESGNEYCNEYPVYAEFRADALTREIANGSDLYAYTLEAGRLDRHNIDTYGEYIALSLETLPTELVITRWIDEESDSADLADSEVEREESRENLADDLTAAESTENELPSPIMRTTPSVLQSASAGKTGNAGILLPVLRYAFGNFVSFQLSGFAHTNPSLIPVEPELRPGVTVLDAWAADPVEDGASLTLKTTLTKLPSLAAGERLAFYTIKNNTISEPVLTDPAVRSAVSVPLIDGVTGVALVKLAAAPVEESISIRSGDTQMSLAGLMPAGAYAEMDIAPTPSELADADRVLSYDITINDGYQPEEPITVAVSDPAIRDMLAAGMEIVVAHVAEDGTLEPVEILSVEGDTVVFRAEHFSVFSIGGYLVKSLFSWTTDLFDMALLGLTSMSAKYAETTVEAEEGLEPLSAYSVTRGGLFSSLTRLWVNVTTKIDLALDVRESVSVYSVRNGVLGDVLEENVTSDAVNIELGSADGFAVVKDTGFRHLSFDLDAVTLDGMMPKNADAEATDATENENVRTLDAGEVLAAYDISISDNSTDYQPDAEHPIAVEIESDAITAENANDIEVWHIADDGTSEQIEDLVIESGKVRFNASSFSVYVIVDHEGGEQKVSRRVYHFIDPEYTDLGSGAYSAAPYMFPNKHSELQCSQILLDGESLEVVKNPLDKVTTVGGVEVIQHFYGWYLVEVISDSSDPLTGSGVIEYKWGDDPEKIEFGSTIHFTDAEQGTHADYHYYLAPIYVNYQFVNFHEITREAEEAAISAAGESGYTPKFISRKMVALGDDNAATILVSDVTASPTDNIHYLFRGWEVYYNNVKLGLVSSGAVDGTSILVTDQSGAPQDVGDYIMTIDANAAQITDPLYYITLAGAHDLDLYPVFNEIRWVYFNVGKTGNGASYVPSKLILTDDNSAGYNTIDIEELTLPTRPGYVFDGWYAGDIELDADGTFDTSGKTLVATYNTSTNKFEFNSAFTGTYTSEGNAVAGLWYQASGGTSGKETGLHIAKAYNDDPDKGGKRLTLYAHWTKVTTAPYKVVVWKQSVNDDAGIPDEQKTYDYETFYLSDPFSTSAELTIGTTPFTGKEKGTGSSAAVNLTGLAYTGFAYSRTDWTPESMIKPDGSTVINVYYDRICYTVKFYYARGNNASTSTSTVSSPTNGTYAQTRPTVNSSEVPAGAGFASEVISGQTYYYYYITANYGTRIDDLWPKYSYFGDSSNDYILVSWVLMSGAQAITGTGSGANTVKGVITTMDEQILGDPASADGNFLLASYGTGANNWFYYIWLEQLEGVDYSGRTVTYTDHSGNTQTASPVVATYAGKSYYLQEVVMVRSRGTDASSQHAPAYEGFGSDNDGDTATTADDVTGVKRSGYVMDYYYPRLEYQFVMDDNFPTGLSGGGQREYTVAYDAPLEQYGEKDADGNYLIQPTATPDHYVFGGWYEDATCTMPFRFDTTTMPAANKVVYAKWTEVTYSVQIDANAGTINHLNPDNAFWTNYKLLTDPADIAAAQAAGTLYTYTYTENGTEKTLYYRIRTYNITFDGTTYNYSYAFPQPNFDDSRKDAYNGTFATYVNLSYDEYLGQYDIRRTYVPITAAEAAERITAGDDVYYYVNTLRLDDAGSTGIASDMRNAIFLRADDSDAELKEYFRFFANSYHWTIIAYGDQYADAIDWMETDANNDGKADAFTRWNYNTQAKFDEWLGDYSDPNSNISRLYAQWLTTYNVKSQYYRPKEASEEYQLLNWYVVDAEDTSKVGQIFDFNSAPNGWVKIQAEWRLNGRYHLEYEADGADALGGSAVNAVVAHWRDPDILDEKTDDYADNTGTIVREQPRFSDPDDDDRYIFRGWYIAGSKKVGDTYVIDPTVAMEGTDGDGKPLKFYDVGDDLTVHSLFANNDGVIFLQAYFETYDDSYRRPYVTNLTLDANTPEAYGNGYITTGVTDGAGNKIEMSADTRLAWTGAGMAMAYADVDQIKFGDIQSSANVHLYRYATYKTFDGVTGTNYFAGKKNYVLLGFDPVQDPANIVTVDKLTGVSTGTAQPYIPNYAADAVIGVTRHDDIILYAIWEPMLYATFVNETGADIEVTLDEGVSLVNKVTGEFDREATSGTVTVPAGESVKVVFPMKQEGDSFTAVATNGHPGYKLTVSGRFDETDPYGSGETGVKFGKTATYTGDLQFDATGVIVTYTEEFDPSVTFDVNGGVWGGVAPGHTYDHMDGTDIYIDDNPDTPRPYKPVDPTRSGYVFVGWVTEDVFTALGKAQTVTDWSGATSGVTGSGTDYANDMAYVKAHLWNFADDPPYGQTLYAVWSEPVTVTFDISYSNYYNHTWTDSSGKYTGSIGDGTRNHTITIAKGDTVPKPTDPTTTRITNASFLYWVYNAGNPNTALTTYRNSTGYTPDQIGPYAFDFTEPVTQNTTLATSWTAASSLPVTITKKVEDPLSAGDAFDFTYTIKTYYYTSGNTSSPQEVASAQVDSGFTLAGGESTEITLHYWTSGSGSTYYFYYQTLEVTEADVSDVYSLTFETTTNGTVNVDARAFTVDVFTGKMTYTYNGSRRYFRYNNQDYFYRVGNNIWQANTNNNTTATTTPAAVATAATTFVNTRKTAEITVKKLVTGTGADDTKEFAFTAALSFDGSTIDYDLNGFTDGSQTFTLRDNVRYSTDEKILTVPIGAKLTLTETNADDYKATANDGTLGGSFDTGTNTYSLTVTQDGEVTITNRLDLPNPTGLEQNVGPNTLLFGISGLTLMTVALPPILKRRRRRREDDTWEPYEPYPPLVPAEGPEATEEEPTDTENADGNVEETVAAFTLETPAASPAANPVKEWYTVRVMRYCRKPRVDQESTWYTVRVMGRRPAHWGGERL